MVDVAGQAPTLAELDDDGRNAAFDRLQARMPDVWQAMRADDPRESVADDGGHVSVPPPRLIEFALAVIFTAMMASTAMASAASRAMAMTVSVV